MTRLRIGLSIGDPAGVGPELALRVAERISEFPGVRLGLIGNHALLGRVAAKLGLPLPPERLADRWSHELAAEAGPPVVSVTVGDLDADAVRPGVWTPQTGAASCEWVRFAAAAALANRIDAVVTGPIQKEAWHAAGIPYPGHTELLADMAGRTRVRMMLTSEELSCVLVTVHLPLADVAARLTEEDVLDSILLGAEALERRTRSRHGRGPRVTVCGLNPHAGEHGLLSHSEEERIIEPAIRRARQAGVDVTGPLSPDAAFLPARRRITDVHICMYHDQGLIPLKALAFDEAVNVTLGLPIIRTSVDHGTAMDIAWEGQASESSLMAAIRMASELA